jgi:hypothetical protein
MDWQDRISVDPKVLVGKPVIKGTRSRLNSSWSFWRTAGRTSRSSRNTRTGPARTFKRHSTTPRTVKQTHVCPLPAYHV